MSVTRTPAPSYTIWSARSAVAQSGGQSDRFGLAGSVRAGLPAGTAVVHTGRPLQTVVPSPTQKAVRSFRTPLTCLYAAPSPRVSASRPPCRNPRYAGCWLFLGAAAVAVGGLGPPAIVGGPRPGWPARTGVGTSGVGSSGVSGGAFAQPGVATGGVATSDVIQRCCAG